MTAGRLAADLHQLILVHGPEIEISFVDPATGARLDFQLAPAIGTVPQRQGPAASRVYLAARPVPAGVETGKA